MPATRLTAPPQHGPAAPPRARPRRGDAGQATVEVVALLPVIVLVLALACQAVVAGQALWEARVAARAAARAHALGSDPSAAARGHLRRRLERSLEVRAGGEGEVTVSVRVPSVLPQVRLGRVAATSRFHPQGG